MSLAHFIALRGGEGSSPHSIVQKGMCAGTSRPRPGHVLNAIILALPKRGRWLATTVSFLLWAYTCAATPIEVGLAVRDVTPQGPIWLAGYAARTQACQRVESPLIAGAIAFRSGEDMPVVLVSLDNCEVSHEFMEPVLQALRVNRGLDLGRVIVISSHTHSGPVVAGPLLGMYPLSTDNKAQIESYGRFLRSNLVEVVGAALDDLQPAELDRGLGRATFAVNRRVYQEDKVVGGENLDGPVDWDVPVLRIKGTNGLLRGIVFGYACHGTSISGSDFYAVSGDYMAYAREYLQSLYPGTTALYLTGMGADSNPIPRGKLLDAKRHGLELAGAVAMVLDRPMQPVRGSLRFAYATVDLPLMDAPSPEQLEKDGQSTDIYTRKRAQSYKEAVDRGETPPRSVTLPLAAVRLGDQLTFVAVGGEVVVDYGLRLKRLLAADRPWTIGYAYEIPCYIPSIRLLKEGGYEPETSLIYYNIYGPFRTRIEDLLVNKMVELVGRTRSRD